ncbi:MAG: LuxR C-terminal-related transcriptional regulator, partial [Thermomicrobiales bacterium]
AVAGQGVDVISVLESLVASSLATLAPESADHQRYLMLETIREFALSELVESGEERQVRGNRAHYFMELAERSIPLYDGPSVRAAKDRIEAELDNIRSALSWSLDGGDAETAIRLSGAIWRNWWFGMAVGGQPWKERVAEGRSWLERALVHREGVPITALCEALTGAGHLARLEGDAARSEAYGEELLERSQREYYPYGIYWSFHLLGALAFERQDFDAAHAHFEAALDVAADVRSSANHASMAYCLLGRAAYRQGESVAAEASERLALAFARQSGNPHVLSNALAFLGFLVRRKGALTEAATMLSENLQILVGLRDQVGIRFVLEELSIVAVESRFPERGARFLGAARQLPAPMPGPIPGGRVMGFPFNEGHPVARAFEAVEAPEFDEARRCGQEMGLEDLQREAAALSAILDESQVERSRSIDEIHGLTPRELDVLRLLVEGGSNRNIADALSLSERTVENHVRHILDKLNLDTRTAAATFAVRHGLA